MSSRRLSKIIACLTTSLVFLFLSIRPVRATSGDTTRVSVDSSGTQGNCASNFPSISADGRFVAFWSCSSNLVSGDTNGAYDVFVQDRHTGQTTRVSVASDGTQGNSGAGIPSISPSGRYVAFVSSASNLVNGDMNDAPDIFIHDLLTEQTTRVSVSSDGTQADAYSNYPSISADGRYVAFESGATNLVNGDTNGYADIFVHDLLTGLTTRVSVASDGTQGNINSSAPSISADGRYIAFESRASNLVSGDTNDTWDIFVYDLLTGQTERVSVASDGTQGNNDSAATPSISADGRYVAFLSNASNLVDGDTNSVTDIFVHDRQTGETRRVSISSDGTQGNNYSDQPSTSANGRFVTFHSFASNLVNGDTNGLNDVFMYDLQTGLTSRVSIDSYGVQGNLDSLNNNSSISANGRFSTFISGANNLVSGDTNGVSDVFVHENDVSTRIISGNVGVGGATLSFDDGGPQTISAFGDGFYFFEVPNNWSGTVTPSKTGFTFSPPYRTYTNVTADQTNQDYTALVTISGNAGIAGVTLSYIDGSAKTTTTDSNGDYSFTVPYNWSGTVTPSKTGYIFLPVNQNYSDVLSIQTDQNYLAFNILFVKTGMSGNCTSWVNACSLQNALAVSSSGIEIWVAAGTYKPGGGSNRTATFQLIDGVALYGGFAGTETAREQRDPSANITILSGDIDNNDSQTPIITDLSTLSGNTTNSYHVVTGADGVILDGFTITGGYANGSSEYGYDDGGGMYNGSNNPFLTNVIFSGNSAAYGGGMWNNGSSLTLTKVTFSGNSTEQVFGNGGGMYNDGTGTMLNNINFTDNSARNGGGMFNVCCTTILMNVNFSGNSSDTDGGGMYNSSGHQAWKNITFNSNSAGQYGGGMFNFGSSVTLTNVTFFGNSARSGGGMDNYNSNPTLTNVTFFGNSAVDYGGGMTNENSSQTIINDTIFWGNLSSNSPQIYRGSGGYTRVYGSILQGGCFAGIDCTSIITTDPLLGTLGTYGGFTQTIPLQLGSSAIDAGQNAPCANEDQRGISRPQGTQCDIGAYEYKPVNIFGNAGVGEAILSYTDGTLKTAIADGGGDYSITVPAGWSGTITPSLSGYYFSSASRTYIIVLSDQTFQDFTATAITYTITGNTEVGGVTLSYTDGSLKTTSSDSSGNYSLTVSYDWSGIVTPSKVGYTFSPAFMNYTNVLSDQTGQNYSSFVTISGNAGVGGVILSYTDGTPKTATADSSGNYSFTVPYNWSGSVTPLKTGLTFSPTSRSYTNVQADQTGQNFTASVIISGNAGVPGAILTYTDGTPKISTADSSANYSFMVSYNWSGMVTPSKTGYTFSPSFRSYTNVTSGQTSQDFTAFVTISGNTGINAVTLTYYVGGIKNIVISDNKGNYTLTVPYGWTGTVTPSKTCGGHNSLMRCYFTPSQKIYTNVQVNQNGQNYILRRVY